MVKVPASGWTFFISHYVQIKRSRTKKKRLGKILFISHYVQIKPCCRGYGTDHGNFISHYVQIKPFTYWTYLALLPLYIPLRSNKTESCNEHRKKGIPLYIPLRSNKTGIRDLLSLVTNIFISHYVQIKLSVLHSIYSIF